MHEWRYTSSAQIHEWRYTASAQIHEWRYTSSQPDTFLKYTGTASYYVFRSKKKNMEFSYNVSELFLVSALFKIRPEYGVPREQFVVVPHNSFRQMPGSCVKQVTVTLIPNSLIPSTLYILRI